MCGIYPSSNMGQKKLSSLVIVFLIFPLISSLFSVGQAAEVEGITFSNDSITINPENPISGNPISINVVLNNSNSESRKNFGSLGWINELSLSQTILEKLKNINVSEITEPIKIQNGILILKLNDKKKANMSVDIDEELRKLIKFETNKQLNVFSTIYFEKIKNKLSINE